MAATASTVTTAGLNTGSSTTTVSFVSTGKPIYVRIPCWPAGVTVNSVAWNTSEALTRIIQTALSPDGDRCEIWRILGTPTSGTHNIDITFSGAPGAGGCAICEITGPTVSAVGASSADTTTGNKTISGASGDLTLACLAGSNGLVITPSAAGGPTATEEFDLAGSGERYEGFKVPDAPTSIAATFAAQDWAMAAITLKAAGGAPAKFLKDPLGMGLIPIKR
jgi:hypothetical protein